MESCSRGHKVCLLTASGLVNTWIGGRKKRQVLRLKTQIGRNERLGVITMRIDFLRELIHIIARTPARRGRKRTTLRRSVVRAN